MTTFIAKIETPHNGLLEFYFASIASAEGDKYFVTTIDQDTRSACLLYEAGRRYLADRHLQTQNNFMDFRFGAKVGKIDPAKNIIGNYCGDIVEHHLHINFLKCMLGRLWFHSNPSLLML